MAAKDILSEALRQVMPDAAENGTELLKSIKDDELKKSIFICLIYKMDMDKLKELVEGGASAEEVFRKRNDFLVSLASDQDPVIRKAETAIEKADKLEKEQEDIKKYLKDELSQALEMSKTAGEGVRKALEKQIIILADQIKEEKEQREELKSRLKEKMSRIAEYEAQIKALQKENSRLEKEKVPGSREIHEPNRNVSYAYAGTFRRKRFRRSESAVLQEMEDFCTELMQRPDLNAKQKDCLLSLLEKGYPVNLISKVMIATLSPEQMQRFIKVYEKRMGGNR